MGSIAVEAEVIDPSFCLLGSAEVKGQRFIVLHALAYGEAIAKEKHTFIARVIAARGYTPAKFIGGVGDIVDNLSTLCGFMRGGGGVWLAFVARDGAWGEVVARISAARASSARVLLAARF